MLIVYFNPLCELCREETKEIIENINFFTDIQILFISPSDNEQVKKFTSHYKLDRYHQVTVLHDKDDTFYKAFDAIGYPSLYLYNEKKELITMFETQINFEDIRDAYTIAYSMKK